MSTRPIDILTNPATPLLEPPSDRWRRLGADLEAMAPKERALNIDVGRYMTAQLQPGQGYFATKDGTLHVGAWDAPWLELKDGTIARPIGQVSLPR